MRVFVGRSDDLAGFGLDDTTDDAIGEGFDVDGSDVAAGELEAVEEQAGAFEIDAIGGDGSDEEGDGELDGFGVFKGWEVEVDGRRGGVDGGVFGRSGCFRVEHGRSLGRFEQGPVPFCELCVEEAKRFVAQRWGFAAMSVGFDVAAEAECGLGHEVSFTLPYPLAGCLGVDVIDSVRDEVGGER